MKFPVFSLVAIFTASILLSCNDIGEPKPETNPIKPIKPPNTPGEPIYAPGQVVVGFADSVNYPFIFSFIKGLNLTPINIDADSSFSVWIQVDSGRVSDLLGRLQQDSAVAWADQRGYPMDDGDPQKEYLLAHFRGTVNVDYALALIRSVPGISWKKTLFSSRSAVIGVPVGQETRWVDSLKTFSFVRWAELNHIVWITY
jgi:hypothetical protein